MKEDKKPNNPSVYPDPMRGAEQSYSNQSPYELSIGMTLRDYFASKAMQGILSNPNIYGVKTMFEDDLSYLSYNFADMMLKQREL